MLPLHTLRSSACTSCSRTWCSVLLSAAKRSRQRLPSRPKQVLIAAHLCMSGTHKLPDGPDYP